MSWRPITLITALCLALSVPGVASADDPPPEVESRAGTRAPAEVYGLSEPARSADPVAAAREHLTDPRYHLDPADLTPLRTVVDGKDETVRFAQRYRGLPVFGAHYLVHFRKDGDKREVVGAGGRFLTELSVGTDPAVSKETAAKIARALVLRDRRTRAAATAETGELVVVPQGKGVLAWHVVLRGQDKVKNRPLWLDTYVDAASGRPLFAVDRLRFEGPVQASGQTAHGRTVPLNAYQRADGAYELRDRARPMWNGTTGEILTYDAAGADVTTFLNPGIPPGTELARSATLAFGPYHTETGAVDAHWGAGKVYEYYRGLGREGIDGRGGTMYSVVNVTLDGQPFINAFWDGTKMVYGGGGDYHSFAASLDVVGHEMTHGVITNSADLVYMGQSGAINEGLADYFGNAVQVNTFGIPMTDPNASLLGEDLCKTGTPAECAIRDLDDARVAADDYIGASIVLDNGGVHLNSTIFSGALWDIREVIGGAKTDRLVYKALTEFMTPLDDFTDGRRAVESAARALGMSGRDKLGIAYAFDQHGIKAGWERLIPTDSRVLIDNITDFNAFPDVAGGRYVVSNSSPDGSAPGKIFTGSVRGGAPAVLSANDRWNYYPATDGTQAAWPSFDADVTNFQIYARPLDASTPTRLVAQTTEPVNAVAVAGADVAWAAFDPAGGEDEIWLRRGTAAPLKITGPGVNGYQPTMIRGKLAYLRVWQEGGTFRVTPAVYDLNARTEVVFPVSGTDSGLPVITGRYVLWLNNTDGDQRYGILRAAHNGTGVTTVVPDGPQAPEPVWFDANDTAATVSLWPPGQEIDNATLPKLHQVPVAGGSLQRYSCNRGDQGFFSADTAASTVAWLDGTAGDTDLVTRTTPANRC
ncbi:bacillolysin [Nonomuraea solani]|uniref:Bacillolysin n=1 Tax=Nonomuraea solani TaxID=1144553 RepID=A0A1H6F032_9ACTN|nr:M4 family metallopeptidase [Nonomuraea solani]SEH03402.1 bacillolysin [Nonomuraea solani]